MTTPTTDSVPVYPVRRDQVGPEARDDVSGWTLRVDGLVSNAAEHTLGALAELGAQPLRSDVTCPDGAGGKPEYTGVPLHELIELAKPLPGATHVLVHSGDYVASFRLESLGRRQAIVAHTRAGEPISWQQGGALRLVVAKGACFDSVKWVERIELTDDDGAATALKIVRARRAKHLAEAGNTTAAPGTTEEA